MHKPAETTPIKARFAINILENERNELLLLKRAAYTRLGAGLWGFPGGRVEPHEQPGQCSVRELREEIGARQEIKLLGTIGPVRDTFYGGVYEIYLFHYRWYRGRIVLNREHTDRAWVGRDDYRRYSVMDGIDEDIDYFKIWPRSYLNQEKLPR